MALPNVGKRNWVLPERGNEESSMMGKSRVKSTISEWLNATLCPQLVTPYAVSNIAGRLLADLNQKFWSHLQVSSDKLLSH